MVELSFTFIECLDIRDGLKKEITYLYGRINSRPELKEVYMSEITRLKSIIHQIDIALGDKDDTL